MEIVPVIDLKGGVVVRARHGERASYRPIGTPLAVGSDPVDVVAGLLSLYPFRTLYVADLDGIQGIGDASASLARIAAQFPELALWIDNGCADRTAADALLAKQPRSSLVLGSESQLDTGLVGALRNHPRALLSLDFRGDAFQGPPALLTDTVLWPTKLIVMTLARVGSGAGPDLERLGEVVARSGERKVYAAGGLRDRRDLAALEAAGAEGVLVASALHDGRLSAADLTALA
jgi:phosphoribosylformimino-5-aminoimidazole carboxamide ribotide isomerase